MRIVEKAAAIISLLSFLAVAPVFSQITSTSYIGGWVFYENGSPVFGATVTLVGQQKSTQSSSYGKFSMAPTIGVDRGGLFAGDIQLQPEILNGMLRFAVQTGVERVKIDLFDMTGRCVRSIADTRLSHGNYTMPLSSLPVAGRIYLLKVAIGSTVSIFSLPMVRTMRTTASSGHQAASSVPPLQKQSGFHDTLLVTKAGSPSQKKAIDTSYIVGLIFVLQNPEGAGGGNDANLASLPLATPVWQIQYARYGSYYAWVKDPLAYTPVFNPESLSYSYSATRDTMLILGIRPQTTAAGAKIAVKLDGNPVNLSSLVSGVLLDAAYTCTLSAPGQTRTFATTVTAADNVTKRTYSLTVKR